MLHYVLQREDSLACGKPIHDLAALGASDAEASKAFRQSDDVVQFIDRTVEALQPKGALRAPVETIHLEVQVVDVDVVGTIVGLSLA